MAEPARTGARPADPEPRPGANGRRTAVAALWVAVVAGFSYAVLDTT